MMISTIMMLIMMVAALNVSGAVETVRYWHSDKNTVGYMSGDGSYHIYNLISDTTFNSNVNSAVSFATEKWNSVLPLSVFSTSVNYAKNDIYSGTRTKLKAYFPALENNSDITGITDCVGRTYTADVKYNGTSKKVYKYTYGAKVGIIKRSGVGLSAYKNTAIHEMGHMFGWEGHSNNNSDIMYKETNGVVTLTSRDKNHIKQIYNLFY